MSNTLVCANDTMHPEIASVVILQEMPRNWTYVHWAPPLNGVLMLTESTDGDWL